MTRRTSAAARAGRLLAFVALSVWAAPAEAQTADVTGAVADSAGGLLPGASVVLLGRADSVLVAFAAAGSDGAFRLRAVPPGAYDLRATFVGFAPRTVPVEVGVGPLDVGRVVLSPDSSALGQLVVESERVPVVVRRDTLDYDASAFAVPPGSTVEDLLRRLPGVEVERDGTVRAQGETVQRVLVDGKEFFGDDPAVATRNLPADAVERVQVFDRASDTADFTGVDDGQRSRTINLALKEDRRSGSFGNVTGALGGSAPAGSVSGAGVRYDGGAALNRFSPTTQISLLANANNVNRQGFSVQETLGFMGGPAGLDADGSGVVRIDTDGLPLGGGLSDGFATTWAGGVNAGHAFSARTSVRGSYLGHRVRTERDRRVLQERLFGEGLSSRVDEASDQTDRRSAHRLNLTAEHEIADGHDVRLRSNLRAGGAAREALGEREAVGGTGLTERATTTTASDGRDAGGDARLTYRRRLGRGRSVVAEARADVGGTEGDLASDAQVVGPDGRPTREEIARLQSDRAGTFSRSAKLLFTQPLGAGRALQFGAERRVTGGSEDRTVLDLVAGPAVPDPHLGSAFERTHRADRAGLTVTDTREALRVRAGLDVQRAGLEVGGPGAALLVNRQSLHLLPSVSVGYEFAGSRNVELRYETSTREPSLRDLQPVPDTRDPLDVSVGNLDLRTAYVHGLNARYVHVDPFAFTTLFAFVRAEYTAGAISTARTVDDGLGQTSTPVNAGGAWRVFGNASFEAPVRPLRSKVGLSASVFYGRGTDLVNGAENVSRTFRGTLDLRVQNRKKDVVDVQAGTRVRASAASYSLDARLGRTVAEPTLYAELGWTPTGAWSLRTTLDYTAYSAGRLSSPFGGRPRVPAWNAEVTRTLAGGRVRVQLAATDLLGRNVGVSYAETASFVQEERVRTLGRHVLLRATYDLSGGAPAGRVPVVR